MFQLTDDAITLNEATRLAKGKPGYLAIRLHVVSGDIAGEKIGFAWMVSKKSLLEWLAKREREQQHRRQRSKKGGARTSAHASA